MGGGEGVVSGSDCASFRGLLSWAGAGGDGDGDVGMDGGATIC